MNEITDQFSMANSALEWSFDEDGHVLKTALDYQVEGERKKWRLKRMCRDAR